jgi:hypothetical protein
MEKGYFVIDPLPWWRSRRAGAGALVLAVALGGWRMWPDDDGIEPSVHQPVRLIGAAPLTGSGLHATVTEAPAAEQQAVEPAPSRREEPALSVQISPGVHITPLSVPPGSTPEPAGPRAEDSEPEN